MNRKMIHIGFLLVITSFTSFSQLAYYTNISDSLYYKGEWDSSLEYARKAGNIIEKDSGKISHPFARFADQYMGWINEKKGDYKQALNWYLNSVETYRQINAINSTDYGDVINNLANLYTIIGAYNEAEKLLPVALNIFKDIPLNESDGYGAVTNNLANIFKYQGKYANAEHLYLEVLEKSKKVFGDSSMQCATLYNNLASIYSKMGIYDKASKAIKKSETFFRSAGKEYMRQYAVSLTTEADIFLFLNLTDSAASYYSKALAVSEKLGNKYLYSTILNSSAALQAEKKNFKQAEMLCNKALDACYNPDSMFTISYNHIACNLALLYYASGNYQKADSSFSVLFKRMYSLGKPDYRILNNLYQGYCSFLIASKRYEEAADSLQSFSLQTVAFIRQNFEGMSEDEKLSFINTLYKNFDLQYILLTLYKKASTAFVQHVFGNELMLKGMVLFNQNAVIRTVSNSNDNKLKATFNKWLFLKQLLARQYTLDINRRTVNVDSLEELAGAAEKEFNLYTPVKEKLFPYQAPSVKDIVTSLKSNQAVIEFVRFNYSIYMNGKDSIMYGAFVLNAKDTIPHFVVLCSELQLKQLLSNGKAEELTTTDVVNKIYPEVTLRHSIVKKENIQLYQLLWKPLLPFLNNVADIFYSPAGLTNNISFNAMSNGNKGILLDRYNLYTLFNIRDLFAYKSKFGPARLSLWGNINYDETDTAFLKKELSDASYGSFLPGNINTTKTKGGAYASWPSINTAELNSIKSIFQQHRIALHTFEGKKASEDLFKQLMNGFEGVVHISSHGFYSPATTAHHEYQFNNSFITNVNPMLRCGIIFSGANRVWTGKEPLPSTDDGILTGYEISELDLSKVSLITLSACETGLGKIADYEGIFGLQRAFKMAGINKLLMSLWQVPSNETAELMKYFYNNWLNGAAPEDALILAQKVMRKKYAPYYWAGFVLIK